MKNKTTKIIKEKKLKNGGFYRQIELNNKTRKGTYLYVKLKKGERGSYYKAKKGVGIQNYITEKERGGVIAKKSGINRRTKIETLFKGKDVETALREGTYAETEVKNFEKLTQYGIRIAYMKLLMGNGTGKGKNPPCSDKQLAELLSTPENVLKWKNRLDFKISLIGEKGELIAEIIKPHKGSDLNLIKKEIMETLKTGMDIADFSPTIANKLKTKGYTYSHKNNGKLKTINVKMIFRKGT